jgi:hypothetical protein
MLRARSLAKSSRNPRLKPAFRSPATAGSLRPPRQGHRSRPSSLANHWTSHSARPAFGSPARSAGRFFSLPTAVQAHRLWPRCGVFRPAASRVALPSAPRPGLLPPWRITASESSTRSRSASWLGPISLRSPPGPLSIYPVGSTFQVRYRSRGLLLIRPLGTKASIRQRPIRVKPYFNRMLRLFTIISILFSIS